MNHEKPTVEEKKEGGEDPKVRAEKEALDRFGVLSWDDPIFVKMCENNGIDPDRTVEEIIKTQMLFNDARKKHKLN